jgi:alanine-synthesizing transaminase
MNQELSSSTRINNLPPYALSKVASKVHALRMDGRDVIDCSQLNPSLPPPQLAIDRLVEASLMPHNHRYTSSIGIVALREAFASYYASSFRVSLNPATEVVVTQGAKEACLNVLLSIVSPGDTALITTPSYPVHSAAISIAGGSFVGVPLWKDYQSYLNQEGVLDGNNEYFFNRLENRYEQTWPRPKILLTSFPHNPTASIVTKCFYERLLDFSIRNNVLLINDFAHGDLYFNGKDCCSLLSLESAKDNCIEFYSLSKGFALAGWRVGTVVGSAEIIKKVKSLNSFSGFGIFQPIQIAAAKFLNYSIKNPELSVAKEHLHIYKDRQTLLIEGLTKLGWDICTPKASSMLWARIPEKHRIIGADEFCDRILEECLIAFSPGTGFDLQQKDVVRISLSENEKRLRELIRRLELWGN